MAMTSLPLFWAPVMVQPKKAEHNSLFLSAAKAVLTL